LGVIYSPVWLGNDFDYTRTLNDLGFQLGMGLANGVELRVRYGRLWFREELIGEGFSYFVFTPKFRVVKDRLALLLPVSFSAEKHLERKWVFAPDLIYGMPMGQQVDLNVASSYLVSFDRDDSQLVSFNVGVAIRNLGNWVLRPETGILFNPGESGKFWSLGLGVSRIFGG
jgi:hypothetical protein